MTDETKPVGAYARFKDEKILIPEADINNWNGSLKEVIIETESPAKEASQGKVLPPKGNEISKLEKICGWMCKICTCLALFVLLLCVLFYLGL